MSGAKVDTAALLARVDIVDVIDALVPLTKAGAEYKACCPFHTESTPSFTVSPSKQFYHCFGCGANGDAIGFLRAYKGLSFKDAVAELGGAPSQDVAAPVRAPRVKKERSPWVPVLPVPADAPAPPKANPFRGLPKRVWAYRAADGAVIGYVYRFVTSDGGKEVCPLVWALNSETKQSEWHWMAFAEPRPMYGLDRLAARPDATVLLVEGEPCADAAAAALPDLVCVSWPGGGKADGKVDWSPLACRKVITWADADAKRVPLDEVEVLSIIDADGVVARMPAGKARALLIKERSDQHRQALAECQARKPLLPESEQPGAQTMARIHGRLLEIGCKVWNLQLPPPGAKPDGWDIADAVIEGMTGPDLVAFVKSRIRSVVPAVPSSVPVVPEPPLCEEPPPLGSATRPTGRMTKRGDEPLLLDAGAWLDDSVPMEWVVDGIIQRGDLYAVTAVTNHGKTAIGLYLALCVATGRRFAGREIMRGKVLILCGENPHGFRTRMSATIAAMGIDRDDVRGQVMVLPSALPIGGAVDQIIDEARAAGGEYRLVLVDTSVSYFGGDSEDDNLQARTHAWHLRALTELPGGPAVVANCHPPMSATQETLRPRGGSAFLNEIDTNLTVWAEGETAHLHWGGKKRGPDFDPIAFEFHGKTLEEHGIKVPTVVALPITDDRAVELKRARNEEEDRLLFAMLHHPGSTFADLASACGWNGESAKSKVHRIMKRLQADQLVKKNRRGLVLTKPGEEEAKSIR